MGLSSRNSFTQSQVSSAISGMEKLVAEKLLPFSLRLVLGQLGPDAGLADG
jgi:hypothetical protein